MQCAERRANALARIVMIRKDLQFTQQKGGDFRLPFAGAPNATLFEYYRVRLRFLLLNID